MARLMWATTYARGCHLFQSSPAIQADRPRDDEHGPEETLRRAQRTVGRHVLERLQPGDQIRPVPDRDLPRDTADVWVIQVNCQAPQRITVQPRIGIDAENH